MTILVWKFSDKTKAVPSSVGVDAALVENLEKLISRHLGVQRKPILRGNNQQQ